MNVIGIWNGLFTYCLLFTITIYKLIYLLFLSRFFYKTCIFIIKVLVQNSMKAWAEIISFIIFQSKHQVLRTLKIREKTMFWKFGKQH